RFELDQAPVIDPPGRTMLPIRAVAEALYGQVRFDPETRQIYIVRPTNQPPSPQPTGEEMDFGAIVPQSHEGMERHPDHIRQIMITNRGQGPLHVDAVEFEQGRMFSLCGKQFEPFVLEPGESRPVMVCAEMMESGTWEDMIHFKSWTEIREDLIIRPIRLKVIILGCKVSISGGGQRPNVNTTGTAPLGPAGVDGPVVNVGQLMNLQATATGIFAPHTFQWTVNGAHIKDYQELTSAPWATTAMAPADYQNATIAYYWKSTGVYTVSVRATNRLGFSCTASTTFTVERNNASANRQAEDFYTWNHGSGVLVEHRGWHAAHPYSACTPNGLAFKQFHTDFLNRFNRWRAEFGYPALVPWNPGTPKPGGVSNSHAGRNAFYNPAANAVPTYLTAAGGALASPCWGAKKKADFANANQFWNEVEGPWHNSVHVAIGGDMGWVSRAPKDPLFWRFHLYLDGL
ncbi:MAG TPA: tyrosinase family protein, partial [Symbiobacteriaceae bacterium]|nr:tyrosinase family protein [Symbiobacteriaceae bacterium]